MSKKEYDRILKERRGSDSSLQEVTERAVIHIAYTPEKLVRAGQELLRNRRNRNAQRAVIAS